VLKKILRVKVSSVIFPIILVFISLFICYKNYTPGTYLTGWDTLHPEFDYGIYWKRIISGAWQSHQGLGSPASQAHASEIPRVLIIWLLDVFFAKNTIRYLFAFLMLILGPLGVYFFLKRIIFKNVNDAASNIGSFLGGLFYLLNLGTLQHFNVPLEMFLVQYAFLGWAFMFLTRFYQSGNRKDLIWFSVITFLGAPQAHTPTLFYVYVMFLFIYLFIMILPDLLANKENRITKKNSLKRGLLIFGLTLLINSFWLFPNLYYGVVKGGEVPLSKIHHLFSEEAFLVNKKYGNIKDISILKNFLFDWGVYTNDDSYGSLLKPWIVHLKAPLVSVIGYFVAGLIFFGAVFSIIKRKKELFPWIIIGFVSIFFILNVNPPFGFLFVFFQENIPLFKELFRFPFTKFSIFLIYVYALFLGYASSLIIKFLGRFFKKLSGALVFIVISFCIIYFSLPAFEGNLINPAMRVKIPDRYFEMFEYFDKDDRYGRVLHLPMHSFWGWVTYSWDGRVGYQGAGFLWFGIKQPLIDREFDRWNIANEQPYREISTAIYSQDEKLLEEYLEKYKVRWLLLDKSVLAPGMDKKVLFHNEIEEMLSKMNSISLARDFGDGLKVYEYHPGGVFEMKESTQDTHYVSGNSLFKEYYDPIYMEYGDYISGDSPSHQFVGFNSVNENIDSNLIYSDEKAVHFKLPYGDNIIDSSGSLSLSLFLKKYPDNNTYIEIKFNDIVLNKVPLTIEDGVEYFIKFNEDYYSINNLNTSGYIGNSIVSLNDLSQIIVYKKGEEVKIDNILYSNLENCDVSGYGSYASYSLSRLESGFKISGKNTIACVTSPISKFIKSGYRGPVLTTFTTDRKLNYQDFCMLDNKSGLCVNKLVGNKYFVSELSKNIDDYDLRFFADARNKESEQSRQYADVSVFMMNELAKGSISYDNVNINVKGYLSFDKKDYLTVEPSEIEGNRKVCQLGHNLEDSNFVNTGSGVLFNSTEGSLCDSYALPLASHKNGYVLEVRAAYISGVPLRICLTNEYSKRCDIEVSLPKNTDVGTYFYLIPPYGDGVGYTINVSNYVFGDTMSKNELKYLSLIPIPYKYLKSITVSKPEFNPFNLYILNEAYDPGWVALCGVGKCDAEHVKVNNWANGWVFEKSVPNHVKVIFWPQYLEYLGFILLVFSFVISFRYKEKPLSETPSDTPSDTPKTV